MRWPDQENPTRPKARIRRKQTASRNIELSLVARADTRPFKDPLGDGLASAVGTQSSAFADALRSDADALPGTYWDGAADPAPLGLATGGLAFSNVRENANSVIFDALISSGTRNPGGDRFADSENYFGPSSIYTCFSVVIKSASEAITEWTYVNADCASDLVATLTDEAKFYPVAEFNG